MNTIDANEERVFKAWKEIKESKETYSLKPKVDSIFGARLCRKYGGLQRIDPDNGYVNLIAHPERVCFQTTRGNNHYNILTKMEGYDFRKQPNEKREKF